mmetsp:Transcript_111771/g.219109  ORF Transcript_111771/g.219109 Transcript_111771/m.219109 type:complete len:431 (-) Transcript_111771:115-1407(-)
MLKRLSSVFRFITGGQREPSIVMILGLDASGKTTFLYKNNLSFVRPPEVITTIPTIGFNVEQVNTSEYHLTCWDVGGCDKIRPLWRHYTQHATGLIFFIDSNDRDRIGDAHVELSLFLQDDTLKGVPLLIVANKCDLPNAMNVDEIVEKLSMHKVRNRDWRIVAGCMTTGEGISDIQDWLKFRAKLPVNRDAEETSDIQSTTTTRKDGNEPKGELGKESDGDYQVAVKIAADKAETDRKNTMMVVEDWGNREDDCDEVEFLRLLDNYELDIWDHYTHVRIAWVLINKYGMKEGFERVAVSIRQYIANSARTDKRSFHPTMTRFWCHLIAFSMHNLSWTQEGEIGQFKSFINQVCNTSINTAAVPLWDKSLFKQYYSSPRMFSTEARSDVVAPDLLSLPDIVPFLNPKVSGQFKAFDAEFLKKEDYWRIQG